jgi:hypothetical protein
VLKIINLYCLLSHILSTSLQSSQSIYHRDSYSKKSQKHYFNHSRLLRRDVLSQFFINRAECIDCDYYNTNYKMRCYMPPKGTRRFADGSKNSTYNPNKPITKENIPLGLPIKTPEKSKSRSSNTEPREIPISSDSDQKSSSQNRLQSSPTDTGKKGSIITVPKLILSFPGIFNISHFTKTGITNFLINYRDMCEDYNIKKKKRIRRYPRYCAKHITIIIKGLTFFIEPDWERLKKKIAKQFRKTDPMQ